MSKMTKTSYPTVEAAALGGFRRILLNYSRWTDVEFGFLVLEVKSEVVTQLGHEIQKRYHYTEPETNNTKDANVVACRSMSCLLFAHTATRIRTMTVSVRLISSRSRS